MEAARDGKQQLPFIFSYGLPFLYLPRKAWDTITRTTLPVLSFFFNFPFQLSIPGAIIQYKREYLSVSYSKSRWYRAKTTCLNFHLLIINTCLAYNLLISNSTLRALPNGRYICVLWVYIYIYNTCNLWVKKLLRSLSRTPTPVAILDFFFFFLKKGKLCR